MSDSQATAVTGEFVPVQAAERIHALDIVRGFALIGIFLMNVEWFSRPISELGTGVDLRLTGMDYAASWFIYTFVQGKFWTMFSLLFGMGFAVMLGRAETTDRSFMTPYLRRIVGLFLFGSAHYVFVWTGDILHNYSVTALALLLIATRSWKLWLGILLSLIATGVGLHFAGKPVDPAGMSSMFMLVVGVLIFFLNRGSVARYWKWGVTLYSLPFLIGLVVLGVQTGMAKMQPAAIEQSVEAGKPATKEAKQAADKAAEEAKAKVENEKRRAERKVEREKERLEEIRIYTKSSYLESIRHRLKQYGEDLPFVAGLSFLALPMFLIGFWFVRSGVIGNIRGHLPLFRKLSFTALPIGLAMTLAAVGLHASFLDVDGSLPSVQVARSLFQWAMMPLSIGYVAALICLIYTGVGQKLLSPLRYAGQMALTNYIGACAIGMWYFSGYGLGQWGEVSRAWQIVFVFVVFALQLLFSMWWLSKFRYGPLEWIWRAITYWQLPPLRRTA